MYMNYLTLSELLSKQIITGGDINIKQEYSVDEYLEQFKNYIGADESSSDIEILDLSSSDIEIIYIDSDSDESVVGGDDNADNEFESLNKILEQYKITIV